MAGGLGNDIYYVNSSTDVTQENAGEGWDTVFSWSSYALRQHSQHTEVLRLLGTHDSSGTGNGRDNYIYGNSGDNLLNGAWGNDTLVGGNGNDTFMDDGGTDRMVGGRGHDTYYVDNSNDKTIEHAGGGYDRVFASVSYSLRNSSQHTENLILTGTQDIDGTGNGRNNVISGNDGDNVLNGAFGNDTMNGGVGDDTLIGGVGNDTLTGGVGSDTFVFNGAAGVDHITDLEVGTDILDISATGAGSIAWANNGSGVDMSLDGVLVATIDGVTGADLLLMDFIL